MSIYTLSLYIPGSRVPTKWLYSSLEDAMELPSYWEQHKDASEFDWSISFNDEVIYEMLHNPTQLPEDLFD
jgi:hypothetical protein